jgi:hypothetical protein
MNLDANHGPRVGAAVLLGGLFLLSMGCSASPGLSPPQEAGTETGSGAAPDAPAGDAPSPATDAVACTLSTLPILVDSTEESYNVPVTDDGTPSALLIDTGSPDTYVWLPLPEGGVDVPDAGAAEDAGLGGDAEIAELDAGCSVEVGCTPSAASVAIGCETLSMPGFPQAPMENVAGRPVVGTIGDDMILAQPTWLDLVGNQLVFHAPGDPFAQAASWPATTFSRPYGYVRVEDVSLNGTPTKLLLDTGSPDVLWLGQQPAPGDTEITGVDALGQPVVMYMSQVTVSIGSWSKTVQVFKVPSFPYFQPLATAAGVEGLFGVSAFPDGVVFDTDAVKVRVAP